MESVKQIIRAVGNVGIPVFGYNFSLTGVTGRIVRHDARGSAQTVGMDGSNDILETPLPNSMAWNMVVDPGAEGMRKEVTEAELWDRATRFLRELVPVAEAAGVRLAAHPDDPPLETVRGLPKLVNQPDKFQRLLDAAPSHYNALEYCVGTVSEMSEGDVYQSTEQYAAQGALAYVHLRNIIGQVPHYKEVFIDEGQVDMKRIVSILKKHNFDGVIIPDHTPQTAGPAPWHAGMAFAMGYLGAIVRDS
jgi:mannonate dehydratase